MKKLSVYEIVNPDDLQFVREDPERLKLLSFLYTLDAMDYPLALYNLIEHPMAFLNNALVKEVLDEKGDQGFPLIFLDDELRWKEEYPDLEKLAEAIGRPDLAANIRELPAIFFESGCGSGGCASCKGCS